MPCHQLAIELRHHDTAAVEAACFALGALSVALADGGDDPVLEPGPGETPLWPDTRLQALFPASADPGILAATLTAVLDLEDEAIGWELLEDRAWEREWLRDFRPMRFGRRLWVCPGGMSATDASAIVLELDPGLAFGTGSHATTAMCLEWLDRSELAGARVLDYGCGSGILALAALKLGAAGAWALDHDPQALIATRENARRNGLMQNLVVTGSAADLAGPFDRLLANILAGPLVQLAPEFAMLCRPGGLLLLAGILDGQATDVAKAYRPWFDIDSEAAREGWTVLAGRRRAE